MLPATRGEIFRGTFVGLSFLLYRESKKKDMEFIDDREKEILV